jgi:hypothetical protein
MEQLNRLSDDQVCQIRGIGPVIAGDLQRIMTEWMKKE